MSLEAEIKACAKAIGFDVAAIGPAAPYARARAVLEERRSKGQYPAFTEPDIALRCDPTRLLPSARSVIALGISYRTPHRSRATRTGIDPKGKISRYAWGQDYHPIMRERMQQLVDFLAARVPDLEAQAYVDTGPPVDREAAAQAGLGWYGKNACLYVPGYGSWVFLGEIFVNVDLAPDPPVALDCGDCDRCIRACPTGAITAPFVVDPHRCISHITQMSGSIPRDMRPAMGLRVFGCDVCQDVCPWNTDAAVADRPEFRPLPEVGAAPSLIGMLEMSKAEFKRRFGPTAAAWRGKKTLQRNAAIALGNSRNPRAVPALARALAGDPKPVVRASAAWALGRIGGKEAYAALIAARATEADPEVQEEIDAALAQVTGTPAPPLRPSAPLPSPRGGA